MYNGNTSPIIKGCTFTANVGVTTGGAMHNIYTSSPIITNCTFTSNTSAKGGGIYNYSTSSPIITACTFASNAGTTNGGGIYNSIYCAANIINCTFTSNSSTTGGGICNDLSYVTTITNCTFSANTSSNNGSAIANLYSSPVIKNSILWGNASGTGASIYNSTPVSNPTITYTSTEIPQPGTGNSTANPLFINAANAIGPDGIWRTSDDGLRLTTCSPAINTGSNAALPFGVTTDITGAVRIQNTTVDKGAYEMPYNSTGISVTTVSRSVPNPVCSNTVITFTAVTTLPGSLPAYQWYKNGVAVGTNQPTYAASSWSNNDSVWVVHTNNDCIVNDTSAKSFVQLVPLVAQPGVITGNTVPCPGTQTYSIAAVVGTTNYTWTVPAGWVITAGQGTISITVTSTSTAGNVSVTANNSCGAASVVRTLAVTPLSTPVTPAVPTGPAAVCASSTGNMYSIPAVTGATTYAWTVPAGWAITSGQGTTAITVTAAASTTSGFVTVSAGNGCQTSSTATLAVSGGTITPTVVVSKNTGDTICAGTAVTFTATATLGGTSPAYQWKKNGANVGTNSATYIDAALVNSDVITVVLTSNSACASVASVTSGNTVITVIANVIPATMIAATGGTVLCAGESKNFTSNSTAGGPNPTYKWYKNGIVIPGATGASYTGSAFANNDVISVLLTSNAACRSADTARSNAVLLTVNPIVVPVLTVTASPGLSVPAGSAVTFTANVTAGSSNATYQWYKNAVAIAGATSSTYTSNSLAGGDLIIVRVAALGPCANPNNLTSAPLRISDPAGIQAVSGSGNWQESILLHPNPNTGRFMVTANWGAISAGEKVQVEVVNGLGQSVFSKEVALTAGKWDVEVQLNEGVANGLYMLRINRQKDGSMTTKPVLIQR